MRPEDTIGMHKLHTESVRRVCAPLLEPDIVQAWLHGRTPDGYLRAADEEGERFWIALDDSDRVVGFASWRDDELMALFIAPRSQGRGIGRKLFTACADDAEKNGWAIIRLDSTLNAQSYYEAMGFRRVRESYREKYDKRIPLIEMVRTPSKHDSAG